MPFASGQIAALTFDCYGTLIDWESGILAALMPILRDHEQVPPERDVLERYAHHESDLEAGPYMSYRDVLRHTVRRVCGDFGVHLVEDRANVLVQSLPDWPPFPDTVAALRSLAALRPLVVVSNTDDDLFRSTAFTLRTDFTWIVTAQYCRTYKPSPRHFRVALALLGLQPAQVLHVAQSRFHDIRPAKALGVRTCWINRRGDRPGAGATPPPPPDSEPDIELPDLASLVRALGA